MCFVQSQASAKTGSVTRLPSREALLEAAGAELLAHGLGDATLRGLGRAIGVSARMLVYHFGSKEAFVREALERLRERERSWIGPLLRELHPGEPPSQLLERGWRHVSRPDYLRNVRLQVEMNARELSDPDAYGGMSGRARSEWHALLHPLIDRYRPGPTHREGLPSVIFATLRGLQLDLCGGVDPAEVEAAVRSLGRLLDVATGQPDDEEATPASELDPPERLDAWLAEAGGAQTWLGATGVAAAPGGLRLRLDLHDAVSDEGGLRRDALRAFVGLAAEAGAALLCGNEPLEDLRIEELTRATGPAEARIAVYPGDDGDLLDVVVESGGVVALGRARSGGSRRKR